MADPPDLRSALDKLAIRELQAAYGDAVTRRAWHEFGPMFLPDCPIHLDLRNGREIEHVGPDDLAQFIASSLEQFEYFEFALLNAVVLLQGEAAATGRVYMWELRQDTRHKWSNAYGLYRDEYALADGRWQFAARRYSSLARSAADGDGMEVFTVPG
ncbi:MAG: hypothetical protein QOG30_753 [Acidimicrobiaceae bacterium]